MHGCLAAPADTFYMLHPQYWQHQAPPKAELPLVLTSDEAQRSWVEHLVEKWMKDYGLTGHGRLTETERMGLVSTLMVGLGHLASVLNRNAR